MVVYTAPHPKYLTAKPVLNTAVALRLGVRLGDKLNVPTACVTGLSEALAAILDPEDEELAEALYTDFLAAPASGIVARRWPNRFDTTSTAEEHARYLQEAHPTDEFNRTRLEEIYEGDEEGLAAAMAALEVTEAVRTDKGKAEALKALYDKAAEKLGAREVSADKATYDASKVALGIVYKAGYAAETWRVPENQTRAAMYAFDVDLAALRAHPSRGAACDKSAVAALEARRDAALAALAAAQARMGKVKAYGAETVVLSEAASELEAQAAAAEDEAREAEEPRASKLRAEAAAQRAQAVGLREQYEEVVARVSKHNAASGA
jgi:hypothetical protein